MNTPIFDFLSEYAGGDTSRFHMPGHKGRGALGVEAYDLTEIKGADTLYSPCGIIQMSENNASRLFKTAHTYYSVEGSTLAIKAMLATAMVNKAETTAKAVLAARNAHKSLIYAAAELDFDICWLYPQSDSHFCACPITAEQVREQIIAQHPFAVYVTSPDYLGNIADIAAISAVCHELGVPLLVDNAHGAYLAFCQPSMHPIALGADMCADSAHKTLPVLTGGAYLHISNEADSAYLNTARRMLSAFASTSPSYLVLASLDLANRELSESYSEKTVICVERISNLKVRLSDMGFAPMDTEPLKIVFRAVDFGYSGLELCEHLRKFDIEVEFADGEFCVLMVSPNNSELDFDRLLAAFSALRKKEAIILSHPRLDGSLHSVVSPKVAIFSKSESVDAKDAVGRICASPTVSCPPAVPIVISGEVITEAAAEILLEYGVDQIEVLI